MENIIATVHSPGGSLLSSLLGALLVVVSYFWLPLYAPPLGDPTWAPGPPVTAWELVRSAFSDPVVQHNPSGFIMPIGLTLLPVVAAVILGLLAIGRFVMPRPWLASIFLALYVLGAAPVALYFVFIGPSRSLRVGFFVGVLGYALLLAGDLGFRRAAAQPSLA